MKLINNAIIFAGGDIGGFNKEDYDLNVFNIICVDKGVEYAIDNNIKIDICIGDFDSINKRYLDIIISKNILIKSFDKDKNESDLELALLYCREEKFKEIKVFGATGSRIDHTLSNIYLLKTFSTNEMNITYIDNNNTILYINKDSIIRKQNRYISILPTNEETIFSLKGSKWELSNYRLKYGSTHTVSNEFVDDLEIEIKKGDLFLILSKD